MSKKNTLLIVVAAALIKDKKILFQRRPANKSMPFLWELPGGKIKTNETPEKALCRELFEELGINIKINDLLPFTFVSYTYPSFNLLMLVYICKKWKRNFLLKFSDEDSKLKSQKLYLRILNFRKKTKHRSTMFKKTHPTYYI